MNIADKMTEYHKRKKIDKPKPTPQPKPKISTPKKKFNWYNLTIGSLVTALVLSVGGALGLYANTIIETDKREKEGRIAIMGAVSETLNELDYSSQHYNIRQLEPVNIRGAISSPFDIVLDLNVDKDDTTGTSLANLPKYGGFDLTFLFNYLKKDERPSGWDKVIGSEFDYKNYYPDYYNKYSPLTFPQAEIVFEQYMYTGHTEENLKAQYKKILIEGISSMSNELISVRNQYKSSIISEQEARSIIRQAAIEVLNEVGYSPQHYEIKENFCWRREDYDTIGKPSGYRDFIYDIVIGINQDKSEITGKSFPSLSTKKGLDIIFSLNYLSKGDVKNPYLGFISYPYPYSYVEVINELESNSNYTKEAIKIYYKQLLNNEILQIKNTQRR